MLWAVVAQSQSRTRLRCGGFFLEPQGRQNIEGVLVVGEGARTPLAHCPGTFEQGNKPTNITSHTHGPRDW